MSAEAEDAFNIRPWLRDADLQDIDAISAAGRILASRCENHRLATREWRTLSFHPVLVRNNFQEERDVTADTFRADALDQTVSSLISGASDKA